MKRIIALILMITMVLTLAACGKDSTEPQKDNPGTNSVITNDKQEENVSNGITVEDVENAPVTDVSKFEYRDVENGIAITKYNGDDEIVVLPDTIEGKSVVSIDNNSFVNNKTMLGLKFANSIKSVGSNAFENCSALKIFISGSSLTDIFEFAFNGCTELCEVKLNDGLKSLGMLCFGGTNMSELFIPESVDTIDMPFTKNDNKTLKIISKSGSEAENYVSIDGANFNLIFEAK